MPKRSTCRVVFEKDRFGTSAILLWRGRSLNVQGLGKKPTAKQKASARKRLMKGCAELQRDHRKR
jgi:hypothetical protein